MAWYPCKGGTGMPSGLQTEMDAVLNKKFGTSVSYPAEGWPDDVNLLGLLPLKTATKAAICSFNDGADDVPCASAVCEINAVQAGTGDPSPSNPRAISGFTGLMLTGTGKNLCGGSQLLANAQAHLPTGTTDTVNKTFSYPSNASIVSDIGGFCGALGGKFKENTQYTFIMSLSTTATSFRTNLRVNFTDGTAVTFPNATSNNKEIVIYQSPANKTVKEIEKSWNSGTTTLYYDECGIFEGTLTADQFEAYNATTHSVTWQTEAGTVYGGTLDVVSGVLTVTHGSCTINDIKDVITRSYTGSFYYFNISKTDVGAGSTLFMMSCFKQGGSSTDLACWKTATSLRWRYDDCTSVSDLVTELGDQRLCYDLAEPQTYQLTPQEVNSILGTNNFYHDANGDTQVTYRATSAVLGSKTITANGNYSASADNLDGYSAVSVNVAPNVGTKNITNNGTYTASADSLDGYSSVTVNVSGGGTTLALHEGKIDSSGNFVTDTDYYYTDEFDCPSGNFMMDFGLTGDQDYTGLRFWTSGGTFIDYWSATSRYRFISNAQYYSEGAKARLSFPKSALNAVLYLDCATNKIISNLDITGLEA